MTKPLSGTAGSMASSYGLRGISYGHKQGIHGRDTGGILLGQSQSRRAGLRVPLLAGCQQARYFKKANYVEKIGDNERTEELLESLDEQNSSKSGSSRNVLDKKGQKPSMESQNQRWPEDMTKGEYPPPIASTFISLTRIGKMLTTPSRLFKLIIPLTTVDCRDSDKGMLSSFLPLIIQSVIRSNALTTFRNRANSHSRSPPATIVLP